MKLANINGFLLSVGVNAFNPDHEVSINHSGSARNFEIYFEVPLDHPFNKLGIEAAIQQYIELGETATVIESEDAGGAYYTVFIG